MSTSARIAYVSEEDGKVRSIYCHWGGKPANIGNTLLEFYNNYDRVKKLIELGNCDSVGRYLSVDDARANGVDVTEHNFTNQFPGITVAYYRDEGKDYIQSIVDTYHGIPLEKYTYVYVNRRWHVLDNNYNLMKLAACLVKK